MAILTNKLNADIQRTKIEKYTQKFRNGKAVRKFFMRALRPGMYRQMHLHHRCEMEIVKLKDEISCTREINEDYERENRDLAQRLEKTAQIRSFVKHDLGNLFSILKWSMQTLGTTIEGMPKNEAKNQIEELIEYIEKQRSTITSLLNLAAISAGRAESEKINLNLSNLVGQVEYACMEQAKNKGIAIDAAVPEGAFGYGNEMVYSEVLINAIDNAIKYSGSGGKISIRLGEANGKYILTVSDNGVGMDNETLSKLFVPKPTSTALPGTSGEKGSANGMAICKELITINGEKIWAESAPGNGTKVHFSIRIGRKPLMSDFDLEDE